MVSCMDLANKGSESYRSAAMLKGLRYNRYRLGAMWRTRCALAALNERLHDQTGVIRAAA